MTARVDYSRVAPVKILAEQLSPVMWRGRQWAVTSYGVECLNGTYYIEKKRLAENVEGYGWPTQMAGKGWVDLDDFCTAWLVALALHGVRILDAHVCTAIGRAYSYADDPSPAAARRRP